MKLGTTTTIQAGDLIGCSDKTMILLGMISGPGFFRVLSARETSPGTRSVALRLAGVGPEMELPVHAEVEVWAGADVRLHPIREGGAS